MKRYFFLGIGVGLIIAGIFNFFTEKSDIKRLTNQNIIRNEENISIDDNNNKISKKELNLDKKKLEVDEKQSIIKKKIDNKQINSGKETENNKTEENKEEKKEIRKKSPQILKNKDPRYIIQLGAFGRRENAQEIIDKISNIELKIIEVNNMYKVVTKPLSHRKTKDIITTIKTKYGIDAYSKKVEE
ncbi:MAG: SPOR domain-containing protein [Fusobacteriota bacterium]